MIYFIIAVSFTFYMPEPMLAGSDSTMLLEDNILTSLQAQLLSLEHAT